MVKVLIIDNYDSFVYNIAQYLGGMGAEVKVLRNDVSLEEIKAYQPDRIVLSPGPGHPSDSRVTLEVLRTLSKEIPTLGICLGHQAMFQVYGGKITQADELIHGKTSQVFHDNNGLFKGTPQPLTATRYHSLVAANGENVPDCLEVVARTEPTPSSPDGIIMAARHREYPIFGLQFHPESILTQNGKEILRNFLEGEL